jgi:hypothetical protein
MNQLHKLECYILQVWKGLAGTNTKHSCLLGPFVSLGENKLLWIRQQSFIKEYVRIQLNVLSRQKLPPKLSYPQIYSRAKILSHKNYFPAKIIICQSYFLAKIILPPKLNFLNSHTKTNIFLIRSNQWKGINRKQSTRWQHLSRLKANAFFSLQIFFSFF